MNSLYKIYIVKAYVFSVFVSYAFFLIDIVMGILHQWDNDIWGYLAITLCVLVFLGVLFMCTRAIILTNDPSVPHNPFSVNKRFKFNGSTPIRKLVNIFSVDSPIPEFTEDELRRRRRNKIMEDLLEKTDE